MISVVVISKDERALEGTLTDLSAVVPPEGETVEVVVVNASAGRLDDIRDRHPWARWTPYAPPGRVSVSIPISATPVSRPRAATSSRSRTPVAAWIPGWLAALTAPLREGEDVVAGVALTTDGRGIYDRRIRAGTARMHLPECPTINMAFRRSAFDLVDGFDERFEYGSDIDFSWRLVDAGHRIRSAPDAVVRHDWGDLRRQIRRGYRYGRARARLYRKHPGRLPRAVREDPVSLVYPAFLIGLPLTIRFPLYPLLLVVPAWRNRADGPLRVVADHLAFGLGVLREVARP